jgi:hypothetical protein
MVKRIFSRRSANRPSDEPVNPGWVKSHDPQSIGRARIQNRRASRISADSPEDDAFIRRESAGAPVITQVEKHQSPTLRRALRRLAKLAKHRLGNADRKAVFLAELNRACEYQRAAAKAWEAHSGQPVRGFKAHLPGQLPGMLDQHRAVEERWWRPITASNLRRRHRIAMKAARQRTIVYTATFAKPEWIIPTLDPVVVKPLLVKIRKYVQRQAKRLPFNFVVTGDIDFCPLRDVPSGVEGWAFHVHLTIQVAVSPMSPGKKAIEAAFPYKSDAARGVSRASVVVEAYDPIGFDRYQDKIYQFGAMRQRIVRVHSVLGERVWAQKVPLTFRQQVELAGLMAVISHSDLMIWVGYRRYGDRLLKIACHP